MNKEKIKTMDIKQMGNINIKKKSWKPNHNCTSSFNSLRNSNLNVFINKYYRIKGLVHELQLL